MKRPSFSTTALLAPVFLLLVASTVLAEGLPDVSLSRGDWEPRRGAKLESGALVLGAAGDKSGGAEAWLKTPIAGDFALEVDFALDARDPSLLAFGLGVRLDPGDGTGSLSLDYSKRGQEEEYLFGVPSKERSTAIAKTPSAGAFRLVRTGGTFEGFMRDDAHAEWTALGRAETKFPASVVLGVSLHKVGKGEFKATVKRVAPAGAAGPVRPAAASRIGASGGAVAVEGCRLDFPKDSMKREADVELAPVADAPAPRNRNLKLVSAAFAVKSAETGLGVPARVTIRFDASKIPAGSRPQDVVGVLGRGGDYEEITPDSVDAAKSEATFQVRRLVPRIGYEGPAPGGPAVFGIAGYIDRLPVIHAEEDLSISAPADLKDRELNIAIVRETLAHVRKELATLGFVKVKGLLRVGLVPSDYIAGNAGYTCGHDLVYVDNALCGTGDTFRQVLAHEFFHIVQNNSRAVFTATSETQGSATWLTEASAEWFGQRLYPRGHLALDRIGDIKPDYFSEQFFHGAELSIHHYKAFAFFSFLDPAHDAAALIRSFYLDPDVEGVQKDAELDVVALLERQLAVKGTTLPDAFTAFLIHTAWKRDREPFKTILATEELGRYAKTLRANLGEPGEIRSDPNKFSRASLPFVKDGQRMLSRPLGEVVAESYSIAWTWNLASKADPGEKGDLKLTVTGCPEGKARIVAFPYTDAGISEPVIGKYGSATVPDWPGVKGAIIWVASVTNDRRWPLKLDASFGDQKPSGPRVFVLKGGKPTVKSTSGTVELPKGWSFGDGRITHTYETLVGPIGEGKPHTFTATLSFEGPPAELTEGQTVSLSMSTAGDREADVMGEWLVSGAEGKPEGVDCVGLNPIDTRDPRPGSGKLSFKVAKSPYDFGPSVTLVGGKQVEVSWKYELKK